MSRASRMRRVRLLLGVSGLLVVHGVSGSPASEAIAEKRVARGPDIRFTTNERFDARKIPAYRGRHSRAYSYIDAHITEHVESLRRWVRQRSVSAQNDGVIEMAAMLRDDLYELGFKEAQIVPTSGHPGVWGYYDAGAPRTLVVYMMYDVQPIEPVGWSVGAFDGALIDDHPLGRVLMARGAGNQKGPERAFLNAIEAIRAASGTLPVNLMVLAEGEEELGSPHYPELIAQFKDRLMTAHGVFFPTNAQAPSGTLDVELGVKGVLYLELEAKGGPGGGPQTAEIHSSLKALTDAPAWRLVQALSTLTTPDGNTITVPGYYDAIRAPSLEEQRLTNGMLDGWAERETAMRQMLGLARWKDGLSGREALAELLFNTTLNIAGLTSGYGGPGPKTILPHKAIAKVDSRLVPNQTPQEALRLIRAHLDRNGYSDIEIRTFSAYPPAQTSVEAPPVQAMLGVYRKYAREINVSPRETGSAPYYVFTDMLKLPLISGGLGHSAAAHAPDEYMVIDPKPGSGIAGLAEQEKFYVDLLYALAEYR